MFTMIFAEFAEKPSKTGIIIKVEANLAVK